MDTNPSPAAQPRRDPAWLLKAEARSRLLPPVHDGLAIAAFITVWFMPLIGLILGHVANRTAGQAGRNSGLAVAAVVLGWLGVAAGAVVIAALIAAAAKTGQVQS